MKSVVSIFIFVFVLAVMVIFYSSCNKNIEKFKEGDIIFQNYECGELCDAIKVVTPGINGQKFSHCGLVIMQNDTLKVIEALGEEVKLIPIEKFLERSKDTPQQLNNCEVGRVKNKKIIKNISSISTKYIGKPYDDYFLPDNDKLYCSELIYLIFKEANNGNDFFVLAPMTYKDPKTMDFFPVWIDYFSELNIPIPEGVMGINPGIMTLSDKIEIVK